LSVLVTPLGPPFEEGQKIYRFTFEHASKELAVSRDDGEKILALIKLGGNRKDITITAHEDNVRLEVSI